VFERKGRSDTIKDRKTLVLPEDLQKWLSGGDRFVVVIEIAIHLRWEATVFL